MGAHTEPTKEEAAVYPATWKGQYREGHGYMRAHGATVPSDGATGYGKGCVFQNTGATSLDDALYINIGDRDSANFDAATTS